MDFSASHVSKSVLISKQSWHVVLENYGLDIKRENHFPTAPTKYGGGGFPF